ncbi:MAG: MBOAT family protein, partial [Deltaproteobacteria bacterium]|nr:MBOAT family protein [Deltaproteobacteria bacterium]
AFYAWWRLDFTLLLIASTFVDYTCARLIHRSKTSLGRKGWLAGSILFNLGLLGYFKYANFGIDNFNSILGALGGAPVGWTEVVLPVGISFFTFQTMSYTIDVYRGDVEPTRNPLDFGTYVAMFPQLVAGPIVRYKQIAESLHQRTHSVDQFASGAVLFVIGFNKKVLLANNFGLAADEVFGHGAQGMASAWLGLLAYTFQIYFDFSGYSDMAVGLGRMLGFEYPRNFDGPYRSKSITEFWRRWHISLSTWIRDYLYFSLGGNRHGVWKTYRNLAVAMLLCGLWHGANWTFIVWGAFHAALLISERLNGKQPLYGKLPAPARVAVTWLLVMIGWLVFRSADMGDFWIHLQALVDVSQLGFAPDAYWVRQPAFFVLTATGFLLVFKGTDAFELARRRSLVIVLAQFVLFVLSLGELLSQGFNPFLYFQF